MGMNMSIRQAARLSARLVAPALVLLLAIASQASAATITATFTGTVKTGLDSTGVFGTPGANLAGAAYSLVYAVDTALGDYSTFNGTITDPLLSGDQLFGGKSAVLTINGHGYAFIGDSSPSGNFDLAASKPGFVGLAYQVANFAQHSSVLVSLSTTNPGPGFPTSLLAAAVINSCPPGSCIFGGSFNIPTSGLAVLTGSLNFGSLNVAVATTPIPAALPLLISALGGLGFVGWRRRSAETAA
ncbi:hypothetical protein [Dongia sp. agr-C8]